MKKKTFLFRALVLVAALACALGIHAQEAYACYTSSNSTLTFYYDSQRSSRTGKTYDLNTGTNATGWDTDGTRYGVNKVVFDRSFADARPTTTYDWFFYMQILSSITGIEYLNTSEVTNMDYMFFGCGLLKNLDVSHFDTSKVTSMRCMFTSCSSLTSLDVSHFNTSQVTNMNSMFYGCSSLTSLDLSSFNTSNVTNMNSMFYGCSNLRTIYVGNGWSTAAVTSSTDMFSNCTILLGAEGTSWNESNPTDMTYAHIDGGPSNPGYLSDINGPKAYVCYNEYYTRLTFYYDDQRSGRPFRSYDLNTGSNDPGWGTDDIKLSVTNVVFDPSFANARPTTTYAWFFYMQNLQSITGMEYLNTSDVTNMGYMFDCCDQLTSIDVSHFNTSKVTNMKFMFYNCNNLTSLDLSSFNTSNVTDMCYMFGGIGNNNMQTIIVANGWNTAAVKLSDGMFYNCPNLVGGKGTTWSASNPKDKTYAHIDGGPSNPGYFTDKSASQLGDMNGDDNVSIADVTVLIDYLLHGNESAINLEAADCNQDTKVTIADATTLIDYLLLGSW